jgi:hypothetical protein
MGVESVETIGGGVFNMMWMREEMNSLDTIECCHWGHVGRCGWFAASACDARITREDRARERAGE